MKKNLQLISLPVILFVLLISQACNNQKNNEKSQKTISDVLEKSISSVFTVKVNNLRGAKTAFGFAEGEKKKMSVVEIAYAEKLNLDGAKASGSGFIIRFNNKNYLITNTHVIESATDISKDITAISYSRKEHKLRFVGADSFYDIAVFEISDLLDSNITPLAFCSENYRLGERVFAIGNPLGNYPFTVTEGIISAINRPGISAKAGYLQSSAALSHGNSGGPLINEIGELVGVNTAGVDENQHINFALESKVLERILSDLVNKGRVERAFFGLEISKDYTYKVDEKGDYKMVVLDEKPRINAVMPGSPASSVLGNSENTYISRVNGTEINSIADLTNIFEKVKPNDTVQFELQSSNGVPAKVELIAGTLSEQKLEDLAKFYFKHHYNIELSKNESGVILNFPSGFQPQTFQFYDKSSGQFRSYLPQGEQAYIVSCGNMFSKENYEFWNISSYKDLGSTLRLATMNGSISSIESNDKQAFIVRVILKMREGVGGNTLIY